MTVTSAADVIAAALDSGTFESWDVPIDHTEQPLAYREDLEAAARRAGTDESVVTGRGLVNGRAVVVIVSEFRFLGGSIGRGAADRIVAAVRQATDLGLPILASTASGGTRMQEGTVAFVRMIDISRALMDHRTAGLPYLVHLRHPTTGGVFASWGSLGHLTIGEPRALIGFLGPKVYSVLTGQAFPEGVQTAENLAACGIIDAVVPNDELRVVTDRVLGTLLDPPTPPRLRRRTEISPVVHDAWGSIVRTRGMGRAHVRDVLRVGEETPVWLSGSTAGETDRAVVVALARLDGQPCVVVGQDASTGSSVGPAALRVARRGMSLAEELRLPLVTIIDTPGAELSAESESGAVAGEIARCIATMTTMTVPTVSVLLGQGCGGGALALLPARVVVAAEHAWLAPLPPEGASAIVFGDASHAAEMAAAQEVLAADLRRRGVVSRVVPEHPHDSAGDLATAMVAEIAGQLWSMTARRTSSRRRRRLPSVPKIGSGAR